MLLRRKASLIGVWVVAVALSCGQENNGNGGGGGGGTQGSFISTTQVPVDADTLVVSHDSVFTAAFPAGSFDADVEVRIERLKDSPAPDATITRLYRMSYTPASAELIADGFQVGFVVDDAIHNDLGEALAIAFRAGGSGDFDTTLTSHYDELANAPLVATATAFGDFAAINDATLCTCDATATCDADCGCDLDCQAGCGLGRIACDDGSCIYSVDLCDDFVDCADASDEGPECHLATCADSQWQCDNGECISAAYECDSINDCTDGSDEDSHCGFSCDTDRFQCGDGACIENVYECDGVVDCTDGSDEDDHCGAGCSSTEFDCGGGVQCISLSQVCDESFDCGNGSDEADCGGACGGDEFDCGDGDCLPSGWVCDGFADCGNGADESALLCDTTCPTGDWMCASGACIYAFYECDDFVDCADGSDEDAHCTTPDILPDSYEPDGDFDHARALSAGVSQAHTLDVPEDVDFVSFTLSGWSTVTLETTGAAGDTGLYIYDSGKSQIYFDDDNGADPFSKIVTTGLPAGTYYAKVVVYGPAIPSYALLLSTAATDPVLTVPTQVTAAFADGKISVSFNSVEIATAYKVYYDTDGAAPFDSSYVATEGASPVTVSATNATLSGLTGGLTYYIAVASANAGGESATSYPVQVAVPVAADVYEDDDYTTQAAALEPGVPQLHTISEPGDADYGVITVTATSDIVVVVDNSTKGNFVSILDSTGTELHGAYGSAGHENTVTHAAAAPGTYYAKVRANSASDVMSYRVQLTLNGGD